MHILSVLLPVMLLIALGSLLERIRFVGPELIGGLNKLTYWVALPSLIFRAAAHAAWRSRPRSSASAHRSSAHASARASEAIRR